MSNLILTRPYFITFFGSRLSFTVIINCSCQNCSVAPSSGESTDFGSILKTEVFYKTEYFAMKFYVYQKTFETKGVYWTKVLQILKRKQSFLQFLKE